jgi:hypothetical protein
VDEKEGIYLVDLRVELAGIAIRRIDDRVQLMLRVRDQPVKCEEEERYAGER